MVTAANIGGFVFSAAFVTSAVVPLATLCCGGIGAVRGACDGVQTIVVDSQLVQRVAEEVCCCTRILMLQIR
jgi:hypothetical protein